MALSTFRGCSIALALIALSSTAHAQRLSNPLDSGMPLPYAQSYGIAPTLADPAYSTQSYYSFDPSSTYQASRPAINPYAFGPTAPSVAGLGTRTLIAPSYAPPAGYGYDACGYGSSGNGWGGMGAGGVGYGYGMGGYAPYINPVRSPRDFLSFGQ